MNAPASILVVRLGAMGDVLHALPAVASLKQSFPQARISWLIRPQWAPLLEGNPAVDELILYRRGEGSCAMLSSLRQVRKLRPDMAVDFQGLIQSAVAGRLARPRELWGFHRRIAKEPLAAAIYTHTVEAHGVHRIERNLDLAHAAGASLRTTESWIPAGRPEGDLPRTPFVLASPFAGWVSKQWPLERYRELAALLKAEGMPLVLNIAPSQAGELAEFTLHTSSLAGLIDATRRAAAIVGVDSGPLHLAAALRKPGVAIFGPTDPAANGPYGGSMHVIRKAGYATSYRREDHIHPAMQAVSAQEVFTQLLSQLKAQSVTAEQVP